MAKFNVEFIHVEETTYTGWVEAESEEEYDNSFIKMNIL